MTLGFSTRWPERMGELAGQPNYFIEKIWSGLKFDPDREWSVLHSLYQREHKSKMDKPWDNEYPYILRIYRKKIHTIREDKSDRWKAGNDIHFVINNRTKNRFQFAPVVKCESVQNIRITYYSNESDFPAVRIDNDVFYMYEKIGVETIERLAINDGFPTVEAFFDFFNTDFNGKIIHWTDLKY